MKKRIAITVTGMLFLLFTIGGASAQIVPQQGVTPQTLLPGALIPKFVDPLPVAGDIRVIDATVNGAYNINMYEFKAQILPSTGVPLAVPPLPAGTFSWVWGYLTDQDIADLTTITPVRPSYLGPVVVAKRGVPTIPTYFNLLPYGISSNVQHLLPVDQTLDWADPLGSGCAGQAPTGTCGSIYLGPQPAVPHIHGGEVEPAFDGGPDAWWLPVNPLAPTKQGIGAPALDATATGRATFTYPNSQQAGTIWFHDHALGATRLNVFAGMAGLHPIMDPVNELPKANEATCTAGAVCLPAFPNYDIPLIIQDRSFDTTGQIFYNLASNPQPNPTVHPYWIPEFIGDAIVVNGKTWPYLDVEPRQYRFRFVNGSNARFYDLTLTGGTPFIVIATDDGYLDTAVSTRNLIIGPGERYEVIVNFTGIVPNALNPPLIVMKNSARTPFPGGAKVVAGTTDTIMQFRVSKTLNTGIPNTAIAAGTNLRPLNPINPNPAIPGDTGRNIKAVVPGIKRQLTLNEVVGPGGPLELVLNNTKYNKVIPGFTTRESEQPQIGATELWEIINITADAHPIHTHLASFQVVNRQAFRASAWTRVYNSALALTYGPAFDGMGPPNPYSTRNADGAIGGNPAIGPYLQAKSLRLPLAYENGWKDTVIAYPGEITRIMVRFTPTDIAVGSETPGTNQYVGLNPLNTINGVGYVWHCHITDHEDNEMMRPYTLQTVSQ